MESNIGVEVVVCSALLGVRWCPGIVRLAGPTLRYACAGCRCVPGVPSGGASGVPNPQTTRVVAFTFRVVWDGSWVWGVVAAVLADLSDMGGGALVRQIPYVQVAEHKLIACWAAHSCGDIAP